MFRNIHYQEFCCMGRQMQMRLTEDRCFFMEAINKSVYDAISNHNEVFWNTFHNTMKEVFHGFQLIRLDRLITTFHIRRLKRLIKPVPTIKK